MKKQRILLFGYYGFRNIGDDMMLSVLVSKLSSHLPGADFIIISRQPFTIQDFPNDKYNIVSMKVFYILKALIACDVVIWGGGTCIFDYFDYNKKPRHLRSLGKILIFVLLSKILLKKVIFAGIGIGPLETWWGKLLGKYIIKLVDFVSVRDNESYAQLKKLAKPNKKIMQSFDLAVLTDCPPCIKKKTENILGVSIFPFYGIYYQSPEQDSQLVKELASCILILSQKNLLSGVNIFVLKNKSRHDDDVISKELAAAINQFIPVKVFQYNDNPFQILQEMNLCSFFISMRFHSVLLAYLCNLPQLAIVYHPKCRFLAEAIGIPRSNIISPDEIIFFHTLEKEDFLRNLNQEIVYACPVNEARKNVNDSINKIAEFIQTN